MAISRRNKLFQRRLEINRNRIEKRGRRMIFAALSAQTAWFLKQVRKNSPKQLLKVVEDMPEQPMDRAFTRYYKSFAPIPNMYRKNLESQARRSKATENERLINEYERFLVNFLKTDAAWKIVEVNNTTKKRLIRDIQGALRKGELEGWGIERISEEIFKNAKTNLGVNGVARSKVIAQTEIISGSNQSALFAADETGLKYRKFWSTASLPNTRHSHTFAENWSVSKGGIKPDKLFYTGENWMTAPGDVNAPASETINCRCTVLFQIVV